MPTLLIATAAGATVEIVGTLPTLPPFIPVIPGSKVTVVCGQLSLKAYSREAEALTDLISGQEISPLFFEGVRYDIYVEKADGAILFSVPPGAELRRRTATAEHYSINFGNEAGFFELGITINGSTSTFRLEVFPRKIDYRTDYISMRDDISRILRNLAMTASAKTFGLAAPSRDHSPTLVEWFSLMDAYLSDFLKAARAIEKRPHSALVSDVCLRDTTKAKRVSRSDLNKQLRKTGGEGPVTSFGVALPRRIQERSLRNTVDTHENRYFKWILLETYRNLSALSVVHETGDEDGDWEGEKRFFDRIRPFLFEMRAKVEPLLKSRFLASVGAASSVRPGSMVFSKHPLYSRFERLGRLLNCGLCFKDDILTIGIKNTALLYEYWCFLKIIDLMRSDLDLKSQSIIKINRTGTSVSLAKGKTSDILFEHALTGKKVHVLYNRLFDRLPTINQKPDNVIQIANHDRFYIFDAKYRLQFDPKYVKQYGGPGPTTDDINTMHRYRDAIVIRHPLYPGDFQKGCVIGAAVLFPLQDENNYRSHTFYGSLSSVDIGGIPCLPGSTELLKEKLKALIDVEVSCCIK